MKFSLVLTQGNSQGKAIPITKSEFSIGRDASCNLRPASPHVSKKHCLLRMRGAQVFVEDLKSTNGTFVNDAPVQGERELHDGDRLKIGPLDLIVKLETHVDKETVVPAAAKSAAPAKNAAPAKGAAPAKPAAAGKPAPAETPAEEHLDEDTIGHMLLSLSDEEGGGDADKDFSEGSTLMKTLKPEEMEQLQSLGERAPYRPKAANQGTDNTSSAAKAILEKYRRRPKS